MVNVHCLNNIASVGLDLFSDDYNMESSYEDAQAVLVRSAKMHDMELMIIYLQLQEPVQESIIFHLINVQKPVLLYLIHRVRMPMP